MKHILLSYLLLLGLNGISQTCDSMEIVSVRYSPFTDTLIDVHVRNHYQSTFFNYPGFVLLNNQGDTVAKEQVNFFGIGTEGRHSLRVRPGMITSSEFEGTLELWTMFYTDRVCTWNDTIKLCPVACREVYPAFVNFGAATINATIGWHMLDSNGQAVATGTFELNDTIQMDADTICLFPGEYTLGLDSVAIAGGNPHIEIGTSWWGTQLQKAYDASDPVVPFTLFEACIDPSTGIGATPVPEWDLSIFAVNGYVFIQGEKSAIERIRIFDLSGRLVTFKKADGLHTSLDLSDRPSGIYLVLVEKGDQVVTRKVWLE